MHDSSDAPAVSQAEGAKTRTIPIADMLEIIKLISKVEPIDVLLDKVSETIMRSFGMRALVICALDEKTGFFVPRSIKGFPRDMAAAIQRHTYSLDRKKAEFRAEARIDLRTYYLKAEATAEGTNEDMDYVLDTTDILKERSSPDDWHPLDSMAFLMEDRLGNWIGWIEIDETDNGKVPERETINRIQLLADLTGIAIENARVYEEAIVAMNDAKGYLDLIIHDIGNMVGPLGYYLEKLESADLLDPAGRGDVQKAMDILKNAGNLVENVRRISEAKATDCSFTERYDLRDVLVKCMSALKRDFPSKDIVVSFDCPHAECQVMADELIRDLFMNLLNNAVKYNPDTVAEIEISIENGPGVWTVTVRDHGTGIPDDKKPFIFDRFAERPNGIEGTGLGLSIVSLLVDRYNGVVTVRDRVEGSCEEGTCFEVAFPKAATDDLGRNGNGISAPSTDMEWSDQASYSK